MITESIFNVFAAIPQIIFALIPEMDVIIPVNFFNTLNSIFYSLGYIFPITSLLLIFILQWKLLLFRIALATVKTIKSFIPFMGD